LAGEQDLDDGIQIGRFGVGLAPDTTTTAKVVQHQVHALIIVAGND
jgi:hypothetical protein